MPCDSGVGSEGFSFPSLRVTCLGHTARQLDTRVPFLAFWFLLPCREPGRFRRRVGIAKGLLREEGDFNKLQDKSLDALTLNLN